MKLVRKEKIGSRYRKQYDAPQTPYQRLMDSPDVPEPLKTHITELLCGHDPFKLRRYIDRQQTRILAQLR